MSTATNTTPATHAKRSNKPAAKPQSPKTRPVQDRYVTQAKTANPKATAVKPATPSKPKPTWKLGSSCPNGHRLTATTRYAMPSGRVQCKACRAGYTSNARKGATTQVAA